jgi:DnaJ-class molecular chaperone
MKTYTTENTTQADGYTDEHIRECPRCHGSGLTRLNQDNKNDAGDENTCHLCGGDGIITIEKL